MEYLLILVALAILFIFLEKKFHVHLYHSRRERIIITMAFFLIGVIWDSYAVYKGLWNFTGTGLIGIKIGLLPLEEYLFFLIVPFSILTAYKVLEKKIK